MYEYGGLDRPVPCRFVSLFSFIISATSDTSCFSDIPSRSASWSSVSNGSSRVRHGFFSSSSSLCVDITSFSSLHILCISKSSSVDIFFPLKLRILLAGVVITSKRTKSSRRCWQCPVCWVMTVRSAEVLLYCCLNSLSNGQPTHQEGAPQKTTHQPSGIGDLFSH